MTGTASYSGGEAVRANLKRAFCEAKDGREPAFNAPGDPRARGDQGLALGMLYRQYAGWLRRTLRRRYGQDAAEDLVQETYLRLAGAMTGRPILHPRALLSSVASNLARDQARRSAVASRAAIAFAHDHAAGEPAAAAEQVELVLYKQVLASMPDVYRDVYVLNRFAGLTYGQIAEHFDVTVKVVEWRMSQALAHCAKHLRD